MKDKAIIIDLDGTAVDSPIQKLPTDRLIASVKNLQSSFRISSATGRVWTFAKPVLHALNLVDPCIISAGTQICDPITGKIIWQKVIDNDSLTKAIGVFRQYPSWKLLYNDATEDDYFNGGKLPQDFVSVEPVYFLEQVFVPDTIAIEIHQKLNQIDGVICVMVVAQQPGTRDLHVLNSQATKEHAIVELLKIMNIEKENTIGVGDGHNDIHLFNGVNRKIAMGNSVDDLKRVADEIIGNVEDDGLADYFEKLALE